MSRLTAEKTVRAFLNGGKLKVNNTQTNGSELFLFGNKIAYKKDNEIIISMCGYNTVTTKDRLNCLLSEFNLGHIRSKNYTPFYVDGSFSFEIDSSSEYSLTDLSNKLNQVYLESKEVFN